MSELRDEFTRGRESARLTSYKQAIVRAIVDASLVAFLIWGPLAFWIRLLVAAAVRLVYGAFASSRRLTGKI